LLKAPLTPVVGLILLGTALRLFLLVGDPLHQDEALYAFWGRLISTGRDPWLAKVAVDKPPLVLYLIAGSQLAFGVSEFAIRLPGLAASLLSIPLIYTLARRWYDDRTTALVAAAVMALTPYPVLFGATAFTDPVLVGWWLAACCAALSLRWGWAGLLLGLAFASKPQAIVLAPLVVGLGLVRRQTGAAQRAWWAAGARFLLGFLAVVMAVFAWDGLRIAGGAAVGFWGQGVDSYGGLRWIWSSELAPRLQEWGRLWGYLFGQAWPGILLLVGLILLLGRDLTRRSRTRAALADLILSTYALSYLFFHWLIAFPVWDRYLLPMVPVAGLLLGRVATQAVAWVQSQSDRGPETAHALRFTARASGLALCALLVTSLFISGWAASSGQIPVGGDHGAYDGLTEVVAFLRALPVGTVLYDRWLSWHYDFYLFDAYLYRAGFPSPAWLATDAAAFYDGRPRYLVVPSWESAARLERVLADVSLALSPVLTTQRRDGTVSFVVYEIGAQRGSRDKESR